MENKNNINWEEAGLLAGLEPEQKKIVLRFYKQIDCGMDKTSYNSIQDPSMFLIAPVIRRSIGLIIDPDNQYRVFQREPETKTKVLELFSVSEITEKLSLAYKVFLPQFKTFMTNIDAEAELCQLFCDDYVFGLVKKVKQ